MNKVLITLPYFDIKNPDAYNYLTEHDCEVSVIQKETPYTPEEFMEIIGDFDAAITDLEIWDEAAFKAAKNLKIVARFGVGMDNFDLEAAKKFRITVTNCPGANATAVGEHTLALLLSLMREIPKYDRQVRDADWSRPDFQELKGKTVSILGFGAVGRQSAKKLSGFEVNMLAYDKYPNEDAAKELGVKLCSLDEALQNGDILLLHLPSLPETYHLINSETISKMKDGVIIVNVARGVIVDEKAAAEGLRSGKIAGFASDVFEKEPVEADNPLFAFPNFIGSAHVATDTAQNFIRLGDVVVKDVVEALEGKKPKNALV
ncbi:MAG: phosphoglycerate dehydrogenase [Lachnospiraceae bacterium]|jgi:D-3-phosphoglycerate dehydrogenase|nr:phosphoglycerate dehydrogenase [Lachnospiraceae bacterium]